jgi:hypothetical protein
MTAFETPATAIRRSAGWAMAHPGSDVDAFVPVV